MRVVMTTAAAQTLRTAYLRTASPYDMRAWHAAKAVANIDGGHPAGRMTQVYACIARRNPCES